MIKLKNIRAVFFDFGETLVTLVPSREALFVEAAALAGVRLGIRRVRNAYRLADRYHKYPSLSRSKAAKERFYADIHRAVCHTLGIEAHFPEIHRKARAVFVKKRKWVLFRDALPALDFLKSRHVPLALVANWDRDLAVLAKREGIAGHFEHILSSAEAGIEKPDPRFFHKALRKMRLRSPADQVLYVGNDHEQDVLGARSAGLTPVLIDRKGIYKDPDCLSFASLRDFAKNFR